MKNMVYTKYIPDKTYAKNRITEIYFTEVIIMSNIKESALQLIGGTPILKLNGYAKKAGISNATILAKLEYLNPAGSVKDRIALAMPKKREF